LLLAGAGCADGGELLVGAIEDDREGAGGGHVSGGPSWQRVAHALGWLWPLATQTMIQKLRPRAALVLQR